MIYTDGKHLITDGRIKELHDFAHSIGLRREWFQMTKHPHYDLMGSKIAKAIKAGAKLVSPKKIILILRENSEVDDGD